MVTTTRLEMVTELAARILLALPPSVTLEVKLRLPLLPEA